MVGDVRSLATALLSDDRAATAGPLSSGLIPGPVIVTSSVSVVSISDSSPCANCGPCPPSHTLLTISRELNFLHYSSHPQCMAAQLRRCCRLRRSNSPSLLQPDAT